MLQPSSRNLEYECGINCDQSPTVTNPVGDSMTIDVAGTNSNAGATGADESGSDFWEDEEDEECDSDIWYDDWEYEKSHPGLWDDDDEDLDKNSENVDEDSDHESSQQDVSEAPLMKRAKTNHNVATSPSPSKNVRRKTSLSLLPTMPLDVLFEIFSHLSPMDIVSLSHCSKVFHETLSSRNTPAVWKAVRKRFSAPDGPDWMSEEAWVDLLFGHKCQLCGESDIKEVDFLVLKRICVHCKLQHYVLRSEVEKRYPTFDFVILLVPSTNKSASLLPLRLRYHYYWHFDVDSTVNKLATLKKDADPQVLHCFIEERKRRLQCIRQNLSFWREWYDQILQDRAQEERDIEKKRLRQIKEKFKGLGYIEEDLRFLHPRKFRGPGKIQLTAKIWSRIRPILEPEIEEEKAQRLKLQLATIRCKRREVLAACYKEFQRTLHPSQWKYLPRTLEIAAFECFSRHIKADVGVEVDGTTFDDAFLEFSSLLAAATEQRKTTLRALISDTPREDGEIRDDSIDSATSVFECAEVHNFPRPFKYLFGWDEIASHNCLPEMEGIVNPYCPLRTAPLKLKYIPEIAIVVRKLAQLIGLDAATATAADFDEKNKRFACDACSFFKEQGRCLQAGYTWRNLAVHLEMSKTHNPELFITVLSDTAEDEVKQCERKDHKWDANQWTCSHCPEYLGNLQARQSIVEHLSDSHGIRDPSEPTDLFFFERCRSDWATKLRFSVPATEVGKFQCLLCVSNTKRRFMLKGVGDHLRAKHGIPSGQNGVHYALY